MYWLVSLTLYYNVLIFKVVLQYLFPSNIDLHLFLLDIDFFLVFIFLVGKACWLVLALETSICILEISQRYPDLYIFLLVRNYVVSDSFLENAEGRLLV